MSVGRVTTSRPSAVVGRVTPSRPVTPAATGEGRHTGEGRTRCRRVQYRKKSEGCQSAPCASRSNVATHKKLQHAAHCCRLAGSLTRLTAVRRQRAPSTVRKQCVARATQDTVDTRRRRAVRAIPQETTRCVEAPLVPLLWTNPGVHTKSSTARRNTTRSVCSGR